MYIFILTRLLTLTNACAGVCMPVSMHASVYIHTDLSISLPLYMHMIRTCHTSGFTKVTSQITLYMVIKRNPPIQSNFEKTQTVHLSVRDPGLWRLAPILEANAQALPSLCHATVSPQDSRCGHLGGPILFGFRIPDVGSFT